MPVKPQEPNFVRNISYLQKIGAGVAGTMFLMVWITGFDYVKDIFRPDFVTFLAYLRVILITAAITITSFVGLSQMSIMISWLREHYEIYREVMMAKKKNDKE